MTAAIFAFNAFVVAATCGLVVTLYCNGAGALSLLGLALIGGMMCREDLR